ncbi:TonB-dependent receptor domain-containing protein [Phascolarctobacterium faecium]|uniref:TonB-dependent receptor domain-containing protein n=1 Tax=Phascolarctobacterium faecium TaxID=33025 RepID=UPI00352279B5
MDSNISKSFIWVINLNPETNIYVAYNDYFILPSMYQLYDTKYGNAKLLPEKGKNYELGFNHMLDDKTMLNHSLF